MGSRTIRQRLQKDNLNEKSARKVPCLSKKKYHRTNRVFEDIKNMVQRNGDTYFRVTKLYMFRSDSRGYVRRPSNTEFASRCTKKTSEHGVGSIKMRACFSWYGVGTIHLIEEILTKR
ncbi:hypothetical protein QE152_g24415 [Popillia japonica]|uniref:Uncharacterized protein n=1 Tax=Popillia japonica TaxID=7064 RepID=A0AAW1KFR8_POPJA